MWYANSTLVVAISFLIFVGILYYVGVHRKLAGALDARSERIRSELDQARRLREEAQKVFADFERKRLEVEGQAAEIVEHAKLEAERAAERAKAEIKEAVERRLRGADEQIAMAEASAIKEVRNRAVQVAVAAAADVMKQRLPAEKADALVADSIRTVGARLN
ncbi:ATP F0F1 synthase subunit B [Limibaculum sp. FT325]|uniref:F0F1 ATP synthase subunit B family protein n=1 Tax=Thermohalobaculum sediminis TaxID=2939436 RepID=UPI0020C028E6|nr:ATP F0F1 synthase subunit B [Limibaculum sediminis]MCL5776377.1 ATP F0F1 synthase subunit B [Limibaculum sediminis]